MEEAFELGFIDGFDMQTTGTDWTHFIDDIPVNDNLYFDPSTFLLDETSQAAADVAEDDSWMDEVEALLMMNNDDNNYENNNINLEDGGSADATLSVDDFEVADLLLDFPREEDVEEVPRQPSSEPEDEVVNAEGNSSGSNSPSSDDSVRENVIDEGSPNFDKTSPNSESNGEDGVNDERSPNFETNEDGEKSDDADDAGDPVSKKRKRQMRNRDAAMRSRERKKMYVKDLEAKSKFLEAECRRLGKMLQMFYADNYYLRSLVPGGGVFGGPMTKPESAVLLLESLLLVSLVWLMANICLLPLPRLPLFNQDAVTLVSLDGKGLEDAALPRKGTKNSGLWLALSFTKSKRCSASRTRMKSHFAHSVLCC